MLAADTGGGLLTPEGPATGSTASLLGVGSVQLVHCRTLIMLMVMAELMVLILEQMVADVWLCLLKWSLVLNES